MNVVIVVLRFYRRAEVIAIRIAIVLFGLRSRVIVIRAVAIRRPEGAEAVVRRLIVSVVRGGWT